MLRFQIVGAGSPVVLLPGWGVSPDRVWRDLVPLFSKHFQLIIVDLPGTGGSTLSLTEQQYYPACANELEVLRVHLGASSWSLIGYSIGTRVAEAYMNSHADRVKCAVFINAAMLRPWLSSFIQRAAAIELHHPGLASWLSSNWRARVGRAALEANGRRLGYEYVWATNSSYDFALMKRSLYELPRYGRAPFQIPNLPILFVWSRYDPVMKCPRLLRRKSVWVKSNHDAPMLAPAQVAAVVAPFVNRLNSDVERAT